ncbi:MAG: hypothetical protein NWF00_07430 [Candidatus Bathyarchaeota archaeon]|nr:hypothetical protein [Candidatus Bathyarchaeota archaeon]
MVTALFAVPPLVALSVGMIVGAQFKFVPPTMQGRKFIPVIVFAIVAGIGLFLSSGLFNSQLTSISLIGNYVSFFESVPYSVINYNALLMAVITLIGIFEVGFGSGFGIASKLRQNKDLSKAPKVEATTKTSPNPQSSKDTGNKVSAPRSIASTLSDLSGTESQDLTIVAGEQGLKRDEQSIMELFLYGKVTQIVPKIDVNNSEGYYFEGIPQLEWDTKRAKQVLDSLVGKGYLYAELSDKIIKCRVCGSTNLRIRKACPECNSLRLHKEALLEHFSCGAVERRSAFESKNGDLVCPKCKAKLRLIGSDYRSLPPAYMCLSCNTLNSEPLLTAKCSECGSTAGMDEEPEVYLYKYTANSSMPLHDLQQIKPIDTCTKFFKSLGYNIVAPAFVSGRSGTQHLFDILILGKVGWLESDDSTANNALQRNSNGNTVVEVLVSGKPVDMQEITRIYGKISDIDCDFLLFVIPGLTQDARNYAAAYHMKVSEGKNIEEALADSKIPKASEVKEGEKAPVVQSFLLFQKHTSSP